MSICKVVSRQGALSTTGSLKYKKHTDNACILQDCVSYLQINHELNESLAVMHFVHGYRSYGKEAGSKIRK